MHGLKAISGHLALEYQILESGKESKRKVLKPKIEHEYSMKKHKFLDKLERASLQLQNISEEDRNSILVHVALIIAFTLGVALVAIYHNNFLIVLIIVAIWIT